MSRGETGSRVAATALLRRLVEPVTVAVVLFVLLPAAAVADTGQTATYSAIESIPVPPASSYSGSGGGDGWAVALSSTAVYNVFHHSTVLTVACHLQSDASPCWSPETITDGSGSNFATSGQPGLYLDQNTGKLYVFATRASDATGGVVCIDTAQADTNPNPFCGFTALTAAGDAPLGSQYDNSRLSDPMQIGSRWYSFNYVDGAGQSGAMNELLCFDLTTDQACAGQPFAVDLGTGNASLQSWPSEPPTAAIGSQLIIPINFGGTDELACFDASAQGSCTGSWPVATGISSGGDSAPGPPFPLLDATGQLSGLCLPTGTDPCYTMDGGSTLTPTGMSSVIGASDPWNGPALVLGPRVYVPNGNSNTVQCFDYSTNASCANFPMSLNNLGYLYTVSPDPQRPTCIWVNADNGSAQIQNFDAYTGGACGQGPIRVLASTLVAPRQTCVPYSYSSIQVLSPSPSTYTSGAVAFEDPDGNPIPGIADESLDNNGSASLTGLSLNTNIGLPEFLITLTGSSGMPTSVDVKLTWTGTYDPSCIDPGATATGPPLTVQPVQNPTLNPGVIVAPYGGGGRTNKLPPEPKSFISRHWKTIVIAGNVGIVASGAIGCGGLLVADVGTVGLTSAANFAVCSFDADSAASLAIAIADPSDPHYKRVFDPPAFRLPSLRPSCAHLARRVCRQGENLVAGYRLAAARVASLSEAVAVTADRHTGAVAAHDNLAALAQQRAEGRYLPELGAALTTRRAAGRALGRWLVRHQLDRQLSTKAIARARQQLLHLRGIPAAVLRSLKHLGLIASRADLVRMLRAELKRAGPPHSTSISRILSLG